MRRAEFSYLLPEALIRKIARYRVRAVRAATSPRFAVMVKLNAGDFLRGGDWQQIRKTSAVIALLNKAKLPYISIMTNPTTGGVTGPGVGLCVVALYGLINARLGVSGAWLASSWRVTSKRRSWFG